MVVKRAANRSRDYGALITHLTYKGELNMMEVIHSLIEFIWKNLLGFIIWAWMIWVTISLGSLRERIDRLEMPQNTIENILKSFKPFEKPSDSLQQNPIPLDTIHIWGSRNSDGCKI